ncbi:MAG: nucleotidyltransferase domain-containing protein [Acidobacteriota bacterium]|nr:nucleotidyltransferase domain-containing protein [Acidobacteriota bacterium]MXW71919.1 DNA polymerase subunit beta [Acidobacteriota bacterium]
MSPRLSIPRDKVAAFCRKHGIRKFSLFGSVIRDDFGPDSDVDVLAEFKPGTRFTLMDLVGMQDELSAIVGRKSEIFEFRPLRPWMQEEVASSMELFYESSD